MTETTNIAALRNKFGTKLPTADDAEAKFVEMLNVPVATTWFLAPYAIALLDALEAERQRADELSERQSKNGVGKLQSEVIRLRIENAALKGDQVPVGYTNERALAEVYCGESSRFGPLDDVGDIPLYDRPQKPVVLRQIGSIDHDGGEYGEYFVELTDSASIGQAVYVIDSAIEAAGGSVKDSE